MKSNIFRKVINEEYIEVNKSVSKTIEQLCELCGTVREALPYNAEIAFNCSKKGKIITKRYFRDSWFTNEPENYIPLHKIYGRVISKDNKTYVQIIYIYSRLNLWLQYLCLSIGFFLGLIYLLLSIPIRNFNVVFFIFLAIILIVAAICSYTPKSQQKKRNLVLLPIMREEIIKRIKMIEAWPD